MAGKGRDTVTVTPSSEDLHPRALGQVRGATARSRTYNITKMYLYIFIVYIFIIYNKFASWFLAGNLKILK